MRAFKKILALFENICYIIDFFKAPFTFHFSKKRRLISNKFGTAFSILIIIYLLNGIFYSDLVQKTNPSVIIQKTYEPVRPKIILNESNFELAFGLFDENVQKHEIDSSEFEIIATQTKIIYAVINNTFTRKDSKINLDIQPCFSRNFYVTKRENMFERMKCLYDFELETYGYFNEYEFSSFQINFYLCNNETSKTVCKPKEEIFKKMKDKYFGLHYVDFNINFNNFSEPIVFTPQAEYISLESKYKKTTSIFLTKSEFLDDYDIIGSNSHKSQIFFRNSAVKDFVLIDETNTTQALASFLFVSSPETQQNMRKYQKLDQLLSNIGGSASLLISIGFIFMSFFNEWALRVSIFKNIYDLQEEEEEEKNDGRDNTDKTKKNPDIVDNIVLNNQNSKEKKQNINENSKFFKIEMKDLKQDSFVLERFSAENEPKKTNNLLKKRKRKKLSLWKHIIFKIKAFFGFKLNENNEIYQILDKGYNNLLNGKFIFKRFQELELLNKIIFSEKEFILMKSLKRPKLILKQNQLLKNILKNNHFGLYPIKFIDDQLKEFENYSSEKLFKEWELEKKNFESNPKRNNKLLYILLNHKKW